MLISLRLLTHDHRIRGTNELFLSEVAVSGVLERLNPSELAAVLTSLVTEEGGSTMRFGQESVPALIRHLLKYSKLGKISGDYKKILTLIFLSNSVRHLLV